MDLLELADDDLLKKLSDMAEPCLTSGISVTPSFGTISSVVPPELMSTCYEQLKGRLHRLLIHNASIDAADAIRVFGTVIDLFRRHVAGPLSSGSQVAEHDSVVAFLNQPDAAGSTAIHYAACFGIADNVYKLIQAGANVDVSDKHGWTPLIWSMNNNHQKVVRMLQEAGASMTAQTAIGSSANDFATARPDSAQDLLKSFESRKADKFSFDSITGDGFYQEAFNEEAIANLGSGLNSDFAHVFDNQNSVSPAFSNSSVGLFNWDECLPDQMLVTTDASKLLKIFDSEHLKIPHMLKSPLSAKCAPAVTIFLAARYAHYFGLTDFLDKLLNGFCSQVSKQACEKSTDLCLLAFWLNNTSQLLYYLKRDTALSIVTGHYQGLLSTQINDLYSYIVVDVSKRTQRICVAALLNFENVKREDAVKNSVHSSRRRASSGSKDSIDNNTDNLNTKSSWLSSKFSNLSKVKPNISFSLSYFTPSQPASASPKSVITSFSSVVYVLQCYGVNDYYISLILTQSLHSLCSTLLKNIISDKTMCCRHRALNLRMNLSIVEEWYRRLSAAPYGMLEQLKTPMDKFPASFDLLVNVCQLLQIVTTALSDETEHDNIEVSDLLQAIFGPSISYRLIQQLLKQYVYETGESKISSSVFKYIEEQTTLDIEDKKYEHFVDVNEILPFRAWPSEVDTSFWEDRLRIEVPEWIFKLLDE